MTEKPKHENPSYLLDLIHQAMGTMQTAAHETVYGFFMGGDPNLFFPDPEMCSQEEIEAHRKACEEYNGKALENPSGWIAPNLHVTKAPFGMGTQRIRNGRAADIFDAMLQVLKDAGRVNP